MRTAARNAPPPHAPPPPTSPPRRHHRPPTPFPEGASLTTSPGMPVDRSPLRPHAEQPPSGELAALAQADDRPRPPSWLLSPQAVVAYLLGGTLPTGAVISPKYVGPRRLVEIAVPTLATDPAPRLPGVPGPAKACGSQHLAPPVSGDST